MGSFSPITPLTSLWTCGLDKGAELPLTCPIWDHHLHPPHHLHRHFSSGSSYLAIRFNKSYSASELAFNKASIREAHSLQAHPWIPTPPSSRGLSPHESPSFWELFAAFSPQSSPNNVLIVQLTLIKQVGHWATPLLSSFTHKVFSSLKMLKTFL